MRFNGEIRIIENNDDEEEEEEQSYSVICHGVGLHNPNKLVVGYALTSKKKKSFLQPKLLFLARYIVYTYTQYAYIHIYSSIISPYGYGSVILCVFVTGKKKSTLPSF